MERLTVDSNSPEKNNTQILIYQTEGGKTKIEVRLENETVWLTQKLLAELFQTTKQNISPHLNNIHAEGELIEAQVVKELEFSHFLLCDSSVIGCMAGI